MCRDRFCVHIHVYMLLHMCSTQYRFDKCYLNCVEPKGKTSDCSHGESVEVGVCVIGAVRSSGYKETWEKT